MNNEHNQRLFLGTWVGLLTGLLAASLAQAQDPAPAVPPAPAAAAAVPGVLPASEAERHFLDVYGAPGRYGTMYGAISYKVPLGYSRYSSSYGGGYGYGYPPATILPGRYGAGIWRPATFEPPGYQPGDGFYRTWAVPFSATAPVAGPPFGAYAPDYGPGFPPAR